MTNVFEKFASVTPAVWGTIIALVALGAVLLIVSRKKQRWSTHMLVNASMSIALAFVLSCIRLYRMPQGGSITPASMLPLLLFAYVYGFTPGLLVGAAYGLLQLLQDMYFVHPIQLLLDYPLAFGLLALAALTRGMKNERLQVVLGFLLGGIGRAVMHVLSGVVFFAEYAGDANPLIYSMGYNLSFLSVDTAICLVVVMLPPVFRFIQNYRERSQNTINAGGYGANG